jgi:hypothetical protein
LCTHHLPVDHGSVEVPLSFAAPNITYVPTGQCKSLLSAEPIPAWRYWSRQAGALLRIVLSLRQALPTRPEDWAVLGEVPHWIAEDPPPPDFAEYAATFASHLASGAARVEVQRDTAATAIETWLRLAGVSLQLRWPHGNPEVGFHGGQLTGAIGLGLMLAAVGATAWVVCPGCGCQHAPERGRGRRPLYCSDCRTERKPEFLATRKYRATSQTYRENNRKVARDENRAKRMAIAASVDQ